MGKLVAHLIPLRIFTGKLIKQIDREKQRLRLLVRNEHIFYAVLAPHVYGIAVVSCSELEKPIKRVKIELLRSAAFSPHYHYTNFHSRSPSSLLFKYKRLRSFSAHFPEIWKRHMIKTPKRAPIQSPIKNISKDIYNPPLS